MRKNRHKRFKIKVMDLFDFIVQAFVYFMYFLIVLGSIKLYELIGYVG